MFRAAQGNAFDAAVGKATDENLTSENWEYILDVCDKIGASESGGRDAVAAMIKRLAHRNANVQLYTLELANATSQNCGIKIHKELASRSFTDALLRLAADRNTHQHVKTKIYERMGEWAEMFKRDPDLGIMDQAYMKLRTQNPGLQPPSKPFKQERTDVDRRQEDEELQMALALSLEDKSSSSYQTSGQASSGKVADDTDNSTQPLPSGTTAATVSRVRALYDFKPSEPGELEFRAGDTIAVLESVYKDWWKGSLRGNTGIFPLNYVEKLQDPTQDEMQREAQMEADVFGEIKHVERLLALLSTGSSMSNVQENDEITRLYQSVVAIRPKLVELIAKYSQKKDDFTQLNEKFIKARRDYESLLEASMSHPPPSQYGRPPQPMYSYGGGNYPPQQQQPQQQQQYYPPPQQQQQSQYPPREGPAPFYMIPPSQQAQYAPQQPAERVQTPIQAQSTGGYGAQQPVQPQHTGYGAQEPDRRSAYNPQELPTSNFDPTQQQNAYPPPQAQQQNSYPPPQAQHQDSYPPPQAQAQPASQPPQQAQSQPQPQYEQQYPQVPQADFGYQQQRYQPQDYPPSHQSSEVSAMISSPSQAHAYPPQQQHQAQPQEQHQQPPYEGEHQNYAPPGGSYAPPVGAAGGGGDEEDYYR